MKLCELLIKQWKSYKSRKNRKNLFTCINSLKNQKKFLLVIRNKSKSLYSDKIKLFLSVSIGNNQNYNAYKNYYKCVRKSQEYIRRHIFCQRAKFSVFLMLYKRVEEEYEREKEVIKTMKIEE